MENWGLITYRETAMLYKQGVSSMTNKERVAYVISHELAHQWFGKLIFLLSPLNQREALWRQAFLTCSRRKGCVGYLGSKQSAKKE